MSDIKLTLNTTESGIEYYDFTISSSGDFELTETLSTALLMSVYCEKRDDSIEVVENRGGWMGNELNDEDYEIGSLLWTKYQSALDDELAEDLNDILSEGMDWLIDEKILSEVEVESFIDYDKNIVDSRIQITQNNNKEEVKFLDLLITGIL